MSDEEEEYWTAEEEEEDDVFHEYGFVLYTSPDGTLWYLPAYYRPEDELSLT